MANKIAVQTKALARRYGKPRSTPGWLALAGAALGWAGDIDFLVSLPSKWPMIVEFLDSWGAPILIVLGFGWLWWVGREGDHESVAEIEGTALRPLFAGYMALEDAYPIHDQMRRVRHIDGLWVAGRAVFQLDDTAIRGTVRRVIFPTPDSPLLHEMNRWTGIPYGAADLAIQESTDRAVRLGVEVRWLREFPGFTLLLADSGDENGYAHVETLLPHTEPGHRPIQRIERACEPMVFDRFVKMFDALWERADTPGTELPPTDEGAQLAQLQEEITRLTKENRDHKEERAELEAKIQKLQDELQYEIKERDAVRALHQETQARATAYFNELRYDITERRSFADLTEVELVVAHNEMKKVRKSLATAGRGVLDVAYALVVNMRGGDEMNKVTGPFFEKYRYRPTENLFNKLAEELDTNPRADYRDWLVHYYEAYNELRRTITQMARFRKCELRDLDGYSEWCGHDAAFLEKVKDIGVMHDIIDAINKRHGYPLKMEPTP